ncbi:taurine catabolism dioxygenase [Eurybiavirus PHM1]|uniref:Taurine catabolism dioxygenase n=1 Tax=Prochlorococcus phage P-HM1 TaxID=445700 RepID=E3SMI5_9CAUD|nr:taurine catabolism dioxygenase [Prochlorococcus phage P-HM1]ADO98628.1 taurine catabolism dioxygenase [Prochlorococcus phage P-HM1]
MIRITNIPNLEGYGVFVDDIDFKNLTRTEWMDLGKLSMQKLVMIIRSTGLDSRSFHQVIKKWGKDRQNYAATLFARYPWANGQIDHIIASTEVPDEEKDIIREFQRVGGCNQKTGNTLRVSGKKINGQRIGMFADGELLWHSNESGDIAFTPAVALLGAENMTNSATGFMVTTPYYYSVSDSFRSELDEMILIHNFVPGRINPGLNDPQDNLMYKNMCPDPDTEIPLVIKSPAGIKGLHYSFNTVTGIKGMSNLEAKKVLAEIRKGLDPYTYDYWWENNDDLLIFDNSIVQHRRLGDTTNRLCHRYQFDYTYLQYKVTKQNYIPYSQEPYRSRYVMKMNIIGSMLKHEGKSFPVFV